MWSLRWNDVAGTEAVLHVARRGAADVLSPTHSHDFAELFWVESGSARHRLETGTWRVGPGDVVLVAPADTHRFDAPSADFSMTNIALPRPEVERLRLRYFRGSVFPWDLLPPRHFPFGAALSQRLAIAASPPLVSVTARFDVDRILIEVLSAISDRAAVTVGLPEWLAAAVHDWRNDPTAMMRGVTGLADTACRSRGHVSRVVRQSTGETATALVNRVRMEEAATRLRLTDAPISSVAAAIGFNSLSRFYELFQIHFDTTPKRYRHQRDMARPTET